MLKNTLLAMAALCLVSSATFAGDDLFSDVVNLDVDSINVADIEIEDVSLDGLDVDALTADAGEEAEGVDALEACYRRFYRSYYGCHYHRPCYSNYYCYRPVYTYCYTPVYYHYWGCY